MSEISIVGLDLGKRVFQVHAVDETGTVVVRRSLRRGQVETWFARQPACLVGMEACAGAHHWGRCLRALGHEVRLMPPAYVKAYVRRNKTDAADAAAICEAVARPSMRFVPVKSTARQGAAGLHKVRTLAVKQRTMLVNQLRGLMAEFGLVAPRGSEGVARLLQLMRTARADGRLPAALGEALGAMSETLDSLERRIAAVDAALAEAVATDADARRLCAIPGVGPLIASALVNAADAPGAYRRARDFAAGLGLTPRQHGTGGVTRLGRISKRGDRYLRRLLVNGAMSVVLHRKAGEDPWLDRLRASKPRKLVAVALANKIARTAWAMMQRAESYRGVAAAA